MAAARSAKSWGLLAVRWLLILAVVVFAVSFLSRQWGDVSAAIATIAPASLLLSAAFVLLGIAAGTASWVTLLQGIGPKVPVGPAAQVMLVGSLGKYVPGSLWAYLLQMELGRQHGIPRARVLVASLYAAGIGVVASLLLGALALPTVFQGHEELLWLFALLPVGLACLHPAVMRTLASTVLRVGGRELPEHRITWRTILSALGWVLLSYVCYGVHLWLLANSLVDPNLQMLVLLTGAISLGFTIGLFAFLLPSGVGVREAVLIGAMSSVLTSAEASGLSLVSRGIFTFVDVLAAGVAAIAAVAARSRDANQSGPDHSLTG